MITSTRLVKKMKVIGLLVLYFFTLNGFASNPGEPKYNVIIDTDGAIDDMRSITMFLAAKDVRVLAITCSQGTLKPEPIYAKVKSLLTDLNREEIPVAVDESLEVELPVWAPFAQGISWGKTTCDTSENIKNKKADVLLNKIVENYSGSITLIALGTLKTYSDWLTVNPEFIPGIERIIWYNNITIEDGFNYQVYPESFDVIKQIDIKLDIVGNSTDRFLVDENYLSEVQRSNTQYAKQIIEVHKQPEIVERINIKHLKLWDDFVPLYLVNPSLFDVSQNKNINLITIDKSLSPLDVYKKMATLLNSRH